MKPAPAAACRAVLLSAAAARPRRPPPPQPPPPAGVAARTITLDNGSEFAEFREIERDTGTAVYFAVPHSPWQRGTNENTNGLLRFYFPKGTDFRAVPDERVKEVVDLLNRRPRKCLRWLSPLEFSRKCCT